MTDPDRRQLSFSVLAGLGLAGLSPARATASPTARPVRRMFRGWRGPPLPVWSYRPADLPDTAPVLFIMHGVQRDADRYLSEWQAVAEQNRFIAVCPEFSSENFPGALNYNLGGVLDRNGQPRPVELWSYSAIASMFDWLVAEEELVTPEFDLFGHSAGAQFAHRFRAFAAPAKLRRVIAANAGWYTFPDLDIAWPLGLAGAPGGRQTLIDWLAADMNVLLGTADTDPNHSSLNRDPPQMLQGPHRLARGMNFFAAGQAAAQALAVPFGWSIDYAPGIAHDNGGMASFAARRLFGPGQ